MQKINSLEMWKTMKAAYPDCLCFVRIGEFYETFGEDAIYTAKTLGFVLTARHSPDSEIPMTGFPWHNKERYFNELNRPIKIYNDLTDIIQVI